MTNRLSYAEQLKILESRFHYAHYLRKKTANELGNPLGLNLYAPNQDASIWPQIQWGAQNTTPAEAQAYIDSVTGGGGGGDPPAPSGSVPGAPTAVSAVADNGQAVVTFTPPADDGGSAILYYTITASPGGITTLATSSPVTVLGLTNDTAYTFTVTATNAVGASDASSPSAEVTPTNSSSSAPTITSFVATIDSIAVYFTPPASFGTISNYEYSTDGGATFTALSPVDAASPITIPSLSSTTAYQVAIRAINNVPATGDPSNVVPVTTKSELVTVSFTDPGATTWTAPVGVTGVQYLVVGAGGGGGGCYSKINVLGAVPVQGSAPVGGGYWIYNGTTTATYTYARMYLGANTNTSGGAATFTEPIQLTASADTTVPPGGNDGTRWHGNKEVVYYLKTVGPPSVSNFGYGSYFVGSQNNLPSGGSGGGAAGQVKAIFSQTQFYSVSPGTGYTVVVGDGGAGGVGGTDSEEAGAKGDDSTFDIHTSEGGSGGQPSRILTNNTDGYNSGGRGGQNGSSTLREGQGGQGAGGAGQQSNVTVGGYGGAASLVGFMGEGAAFCGGGSGGAPNTDASGATTENRGYGGKGTGCAVNSFASGIKGGSGLVRLKYYI